MAVKKENLDMTWEFDVPYFDFRNNPAELEDGADKWFDTVAYQSLNNDMPKMSNASALRRSPRLALLNTFENCNSPQAKKSRCEPTGRNLSVGHRIQRTSSRYTLRKLRQRHSSGGNRGSAIVRRLYRRPSKPSCVEAGPVDFVASLRQNQPMTSMKPVIRATHPVPFKLSGAAERPKDVAVYHSIAEQVHAFHHRTPARFRSRKHTGSANNMPNNKPAIAPMPQSPRLLTRLRSRAVQVLSQDQREVQEMAEMKRFQFHARPVSEALFLGKQVLPAVEPRPTTTFQPFNLHAPHQRPAPPKDDTPAAVEFRARPVPRGLFDKPQMPVAMGPSPTVAQSPAFNLRSRSQQWKVEAELKKQKESELQQSQQFVRPKLPSSSASSEPFVPRLEHKATKVEPFTFDEKDKVRQLLKEQQIKELLEKEQKLREFHANPVPNFELSGLAPKQVPQATQLAPFHLVTDELGERRRSKWVKQMEEELQKQAEMTRFKAQPCTSLGSPFIPQRSDKPFTDFTNTKLHTELRAKEREAFDEKLRMKEAEKEQIMIQREKEREDEQRREMAVARKNTVHQAQPVRHYKGVDIIPGQSPVCPQSPNLFTKKRKRQM